MLGRVAAAEVPAHPIRVGTNHEQVTARAEVAVARAGGQYDNVAGSEFEGPALGTAEHHVRASGGDSEHFVGRRVEVVEREG